MKMLYSVFIALICSQLSAQTKEEILKDIKDRETKAVELVEMQLKAYNEQDVEAFISPYSDDVEVYSFPDVLRYRGKEKLRESYAALFKQSANRKATVTNRMVYGSQVIDYEEITGLPNGIIVHAVAIYMIDGDKISKVFFLRQLR